MIGFLPILHDDELFSSLLMRLFEEGAYIYPKHFLNEILDGKQRFNYLYVNRLKPELIDLLDKTYGWKNIIQNHTLEGWNNLFGKYSGVSPTKGFIRYCPFCLKEKKYIQLLPQLREIHYCPEHGYKYMQSDISLNRNANYLIKPISDFLCQKTDSLKQVDLDDINVKVSKYINNVITASRNDLKQAKINDYIREHIPKEYFRSKTRAKINSAKIKQALDEFFGGLEGYSLNERQIKRIMSGESFSPYQICLLAYWLGISPNKLVNKKVVVVVPIDTKVIAFRKNGLSQRQIAQKLNLSKTKVNMILSSKNHK